MPDPVAPPPTESDVAGLCERLRDWANHNRFRGVSEEANATAFICNEAAARLQAQAEEIERLNREIDKEVYSRVEHWRSSVEAARQEIERLRATIRKLEA